MKTAIHSRRRRRLRDSVIQEVAPDGTELFRWNSWDHMDVEPDCLMVEKYLIGRTEYAHLNSLQIADGDIIASFRGCAQVLRIDRSSGAVVWKLGGIPPEPDSTHTFTYLPLVGDPAGEFCGQHHVTLTASGTIVMFDNGVQCLGPRKTETPFSRVVEYDISSGTQAVFMREYERPPEQGHSQTGGGVTVINDDLNRNNDRWLITWGGIIVDATVGLQQLIAISEVDPVSGTSLFDLSMFKSGDPARTLSHLPSTGERRHHTLESPLALARDGRSAPASGTAAGGDRVVLENFHPKRPFIASMRPRAKAPANQRPL